VSVYQLNREIAFPHPSLANENGLLAVGGDLSPERIITAYANGIFPWYNKGEPILWWSPNPRCVMFPGNFRASKSLKLLIKKNIFEVRFDTAFGSVISKCAKVHQANHSETWITSEMKKAYILLHKLGFAHSVETYLNNELVGGLYGIAIGKVFYGESMFHTVSNASKVAFYFLVDRLKQWHFDIIDNQTTTNHLLKLGAEEIDRDKFLAIIEKSIAKGNHSGKW
jgi:leucyl/phenylalanyl-tRNA--protein transferase